MTGCLCCQQLNPKSARQDRMSACHVLQAAGAGAGADTPEPLAPSQRQGLLLGRQGRVGCQQQQQQQQQLEGNTSLAGNFCREFLQSSQTKFHGNCGRGQQ
jgi:hypothetical protein